MKGLLEEAFAHNEEIEQGPLLDAALIGALQRVEHYEIAAYGALATLAEAMGQDEIHELLGETLEEEKATDEKLSEVAGDVNSEAIRAGEEEEDGEGEEEDEEDEVDEEDGEGEPAPKRSVSKPAKKSKR